jgi:hypothetical protein
MYPAALPDHVRSAFCIPFTLYPVALSEMLPAGDDTATDCEAVSAALELSVTIRVTV